MRLTLYLVPDRGPISPVDLDLLEIFRTLTPPRPADRLGRDQLQLLCDAIRRRYGGVRPESNLDGLARVYANFGHADRFDGVVLRVEGEIPSVPAARDEQLGAIQAEIRRRDLEIRELQAELRRERQARDAHKSLLDQLTEQVEQTRQTLASVQGAGADAEQRAEAARQQLSRTRVERDQLERTVDQLRATLAARDEQIEELRQQRRQTDRAHEPNPMLEF